MKIAITGHNGFLGKHLLKRLTEEKKSYTVLSDTINLCDPLHLKELVEDTDIIIHLAGKNRDTNFNILNANVTGTASVMEALSLFAPKARCIFASSSQVYTENNMYGVSKKLAEEILEKYALFLGVKSISLRISNIFGPGCKPDYNSVIATFIDQVRQEKSLSINGDGTQRKDFLYVTDVVNAIMRVIDYKQKDIFEYFNICSGRQSSLNEIVGIMEKITEKKIPVIYNKTIKKITEKNVSMTNENAKKQLRWKPEISLEEGLQILLKNV